MGKLVIIDGNAIMHRAFHAMPPLTTKKGEPINAVYGLVSMLLNVIQNLDPTHIVFAFDEKEKTFRQKELSTYQAQRPEMVDELSSQFSKARDFLKAAKIPVYSMGGYEADDVIGTLATRATRNEIEKGDRERNKKSSQITNSNLKSKIDEVVIVTGDRDILQLVNDKENIKLYMPIAGLANAKFFGEKETVERMGVLPSQIPDLKALTGDPSDNYFGVPGIGPKTAINLLNEFGSFNNIYKNISKQVFPSDKVPEKIREKLEKGKESAFLSYKLATIILDVPIKFDFNSMSNWDLDSSEVLNLFAEFGFKTLTDRIKKVGKEIDEEKQGILF